MAFNRDRGFGGRGGGRGFQRRDFDRPEMHSAICSNCGKSCEVPFKPTGDKPVYCSDCFQQQGGGRENRDSRPSFRRPDFQERGNSNQTQLKEQLDSLDAKLDKILSLLSKDSQD